MRQDATKRVRLAITSIMDAYGVPYQDVRRSNNPGIMFTVQGQTRTITYHGGDPRAHMNARTQTRRMLNELGLVPQQPIDDRVIDDDQAPTSDDQAPPSGELLDMDTIYRAPNVSPPIENTTASDGPRDTNEPNVPPSIDVPSTADPVDEPPRYTEGGYVVFTPTKYQNQVRLSEGRFFAIKLDRDLLAAKGSYLVIPFDIPDVVWDMPPHEFQSCFAAMRPAPEPIIEVHEEPIVPSQTKPLQTMQPQPPPPSEPEPDEEESEDELAHFPQAAEPPSEQRRGVSPQMGRVLLAMQFLHQQGEIEITGHAIQTLLSPVDAKQVSGMLSGAMKHRYVARGSTLDTGRGSRYNLTASGRKFVMSLGTWPYDHRGLAVPPWLRESLTARA